LKEGRNFMESKQRNTKSGHEPEIASTGVLPSTMRAVVQDEFGQAGDVLGVEQNEPLPEIADGEVLVKVHAAGVDRGVWHLIAGLPYMVRIAGFGIRRPKLRVPGFDFAGRVERVGAEVDSVKPGDEVFGIAKGSFAEYASAVEDKVVRMPETIGPQQAAAVPISGLTALQAVRDQAKLGPGESLLILGASGGVGSFAVQIAKAFGAEVTGVCSAAKVEMVRELGADHVIDYTRGDLGDSGEEYDAILDIGGNRSLSQLRRLLKPKGRLVIVGGEDAGKLLGGTDRQLRAMLLSPFVSQKLGAFISSENGQDIMALRELVDSGRLKPAIDRTFRLEQAADAIQYLEEGRATGKVVLDIG
jgi:NADPH:quinone reductase-like Zn-dependent oxidoreductase